MKTLIKADVATQSALSILVFAKLPFAWWLYPASFLLADLSMLGYAINAKVGASMYNLAQHKGVAIVTEVIGLFLDKNHWLLAGII